MSAPGVAHQVGGVPAELVEDRHDVADRFGDGELALGGRGRQPALLEGCNPMTRADFLHRIVEVVEVQGGPAVQGKYRRSLPEDPARDSTRPCDRRERRALHPWRVGQKADGVRALQTTAIEATAAHRSMIARAHRPGGRGNRQEGV